MVETHGRLNLAMIRKLAEGIAEFKPMFLEEPCGPEYTSAMEKLSQETTVPLATGERLYTRWGFRELFEREAVPTPSPTSDTPAALRNCARSQAWRRHTGLPWRHTTRSVC